MKKIKIMLMSLLVLAVVGGAFAFKAQNKSTGFWCSTEPSEAQFCDQDFVTELTIAVNPPSIPGYYCTEDNGGAPAGPCDLQAYEE